MLFEELKEFDEEEFEILWLLTYFICKLFDIVSSTQQKNLQLLFTQQKNKRPKLSPDFVTLTCLTGRGGEQ